MKDFLGILLLLLLPSISWAGTVSYDVPLGQKEQQMVDFYAQRQNRTAQAVVRYMCDVGMTSFRDEYRRLTEQSREQAIQQLTPENRAAYCAALATTGYAGDECSPP